MGSKGDAAGFPTGSVVQYAGDAQGRPVFAFSSLSNHMQDLRSDSRCSLTVTAPTFKASTAGACTQAALLTSQGQGLGSTPENVCYVYE